MSGPNAGIFAGDFDDEIALGPDGNRAYFGREVLRGLIDGIDDFVQLRQPRWKQFRSLGPALIGSAMWIDDPQLAQSFERLAHVCVVVRKERREHRKLPMLKEVADRVPGIPTEAFSELSDLAPKVGGTPLVVGPYERWHSVVPSIRSIGVRARDGGYVPIVHAKLALLGHFWWHDEGADGGVDDVIGFTPKRLWVSSANFTRASRGSLEFGYWTEDPALVEGALRFLLRLVAASEQIDAEADEHDPELAGIEFDDAAMGEALAETAAYDDDESHE